MAYTAKNGHNLASSSPYLHAQFEIFHMIVFPCFFNFSRSSQLPYTIVSSFLTLLCCSSTVWCQDDEDGDFQSGLIGRYRMAEKIELLRIDERVAFDWHADGDDSLQKEIPMAVKWRGYLLTRASGEFRISFYGAGVCRIRINGNEILHVERDEVGWEESVPVDLSFDYQTLEIDYHRSAGAPQQISLFWRGPRFQLEPLEPRYLFHEPASAPEGKVARGEGLVRAYRCNACHTIGPREVLPAPALNHLAGNVRSDWLVERLSHHISQNGHSGQKMPNFGLSQEESQLLTDYLLRDRDEPTAKSAVAKGGRLAFGEKLFFSVGCLACHQIGDLGTNSLFSGGDLSRIAEKRPAEFFWRWLDSPQTINAQHRMPVFALEEVERNDLATFLTTLHRESFDGSILAEVRPIDDRLNQAQRLFEALRCASCHGSENGNPKPLHKINLDADADWLNSCVGDRNIAPPRPGYHLSREETSAIRAYAEAFLDPDQHPPSTPPSFRLMEENNCQSCHARDSRPGIASKLLAVVERHGELAPRVPALAPPPLNSVGDKLHDQILREIIRGKHGVQRPWLDVRMPKFHLSDTQVETIVAHLVLQDRIPPGHAGGQLAGFTEEEQRTLQRAGRRLVTPDGFGCTSCHQVGDLKPVKAPLNARGADLTMLQKRIRRPWFDRWVRNPARIVPRMEMPSVQIPVAGVLQDDLDHQLAAVWQVLNQPDFQPPQPDPIRVVRQSGVEIPAALPVILTDVVKTTHATFVKPLVIGLPNRHNLLFDFQAGSLVSWWTGDVARQRTEGKTWFWEAAEPNLLDASTRLGDFRIRRGQQILLSQSSGQFTSEIDSVSKVDSDLIFTEHRAFASADGKETATIQLEHRFSPLWSVENLALGSGFNYAVRVAGLKTGDLWECHITAPYLREVAWPTVAAISLNPADEILILNDSEGELEFSKDASAIFSRLADEQGQAKLRFSAVVTFAADAFLNPSVERSSPPLNRLRVVPGFEAARLPFDDDFMPTGMAWRPNGDLVVTSLKGRVWIAHDTDGDQVEDVIAPFSDELAAPYGVYAEDDYVDVINKYALLRLFDENNDGVVEKMVTLASGWGHTADYHDWVVGLPKDSHGNYYVALPCQQDQRSLAAAQFRGTILKLVPRESSRNDPRLYAVEMLTGGHRFPMGIARNQRGDMFVTDNQGNYNPFNELNHVVAGMRYGFINAVERSPDFKPPLTPPAINIPHPWTRSVNGICFLETPEDLLSKRNASVFGPFEGHLIGCEYDTRRLIRMSLQQVGDTFQGAAYPFSFDQPTSGPPLLGPLVCAVSPDGALYIGCIRDSGWGGANNIGTLVKMRANLAEIPTGISQVEATADGFIIDFTAAIDPVLAVRKENYSIASYTRSATPAYGGEDEQRREETIVGIKLSTDARRVMLHLGELQAGFVYEIKLKKLVAKDKLFFPDQAHYTMRVIPIE